MVRFLEGSEGPILGLHVLHKITPAEYEKLSEQMEEMADEHEHVRLLLLFDHEFAMMDPAAFWEELRISLEPLGEVDRVALIGSRKWSEAYSGTIEPHLPSIDMRRYDPGTADQAWLWLREN